MTDPIVNPAAQAQVAPVARKFVDKGGKAEAAPSAPPSETEINARRAAAAAHDAPSVGFTEVQKRLKEEKKIQAAAAAKAAKLREAKEELFNLRFQGATGQLESHGRLRAIRTDIARIYTILRERELGITPTNGTEGAA
jgi:large subunit ribosomal protein L29